MRTGREVGRAAVLFVDGVVGAAAAMPEFTSHSSSQSACWPSSSTAKHNSDYVNFGMGAG